VRMVADDRTENARTAAELRRPQAALAGVTGALLAIRLLGRAADIADALGLVGTGATLRELVIDHARDDVAAHGDAEHLVRKIDVADCLVVERCNRTLHRRYSFLLSSAGAASAAVAAPRSAAGNGRPSGALRLAASRIRTNPPSAPGTAPLTRIRPSAASVFTMRRFCTV